MCYTEQKKAGKNKSKQQRAKIRSTIFAYQPFLLIQSTSPLINTNLVACLIAFSTSLFFELTAFTISSPTLTAESMISQTINNPQKNSPIPLITDFADLSCMLSVLFIYNSCDELKLE